MGSFVNASKLQCKFRRESLLTMQASKGKGEAKGEAKVERSEKKGQSPDR
jgi:hypothetical protein